MYCVTLRSRIDSRITAWYDGSDSRWSTDHKRQRLFDKKGDANPIWVGLAERLGRPIGEISVGELQRALFARLVLQDAAVILLDEPFAAVDARTVPVLLDQVTRWHQQGRTVITVVHDLDLVRACFPATLALARRCLAWGPTETALPAMAA